MQHEMQHEIISIRAPARGATDSGFLRQLHQRISIRAPARGATQVALHINSLVKISIRAPARGATSIWIRYLISLRFQSALPRGERLDHRTSIPHASHISIRAPARGATSCGRSLVKGRYFNPRSREGSDPTGCTPFRAYHYFNPRSREGSDSGIVRKQQEMIISIRAPARGATEKTRNAALCV